MSKSIPLLLLVLLFAHRSFAQDTPSIDQSIVAIRAAGKLGVGFDKAIVAADLLRQTPINNLTVLLDGLEGTNPIGENWIRGVVFDIVRRADSIPVETLAKYTIDPSNNPTGRGLAMELIQKESPATAKKLISNCLDEVSLPLREMAVQQKIDQAKNIEKKDPESAKTNYREALAAARQPQQLESIVKALRKLGDEDVSINSAFAMIGQWNSLAPMNNKNGVGYDTEYGPEKEFVDDGSVDLDQDHPGKEGSISWTKTVATGDKGEVDLAVAYDKEKGAVCYLYAEFESSTSRPAQARLGSANANKVWVNGKLVMANKVYHSGEMIDQYVANVQLEKGTNRILLKICQNEQTDSWAQAWSFQFRITDPSGEALHSGD